MSTENAFESDDFVFALIGDAEAGPREKNEDSGLRILAFEEDATGCSSDGVLKESRQLLTCPSMS